MQGAVQLINYRDTWFSLRNCLEYFIWFSSPTAHPREAGFIPLGGNTVFVRRTLLREVGGWDGDLPRRGLRAGRAPVQPPAIVVAYSPAS